MESICGLQRKGRPIIGFMRRPRGCLDGARNSDHAVRHFWGEGGIAKLRSHAFLGRTLWIHPHSKVGIHQDNLGLHPLFGH